MLASPPAANLPPRDPSAVLREAAKTPWMWGAGVGVIVVLAIAAALGAYFASRGGDTPPQAEPVAAAPAPPPPVVEPVANATPAAPIAAVTPAPPAAPPTVSSTIPKPPAVAAGAAAPRVASSTNASTAKPGAKPAPTTAAAAPVAAAISRDAEAAQLLEIAKAKLVNNLNDQALSDLRQLMVNFPGSRAATEAAFLAAEIHEKTGRLDDAMAAYVEFESRFGTDRRTADAKLRRSAILGRQRQPKPQAMALQLLNDVVRDFPGTPQALIALQNKLRIENDRRDLRGIDPVTKEDVPALVATLRTIIEQFPEAPEAMAARNRLAMAYTQLNRHAEAAQALEDLGSRGGNPADVWFRLGEIYERRLNNPAKAQEAYAKVPPGSPRYNDAQRKLKRR